MENKLEAYKEEIEALDEARQERFEVSCRKI